MVDKDVHGPKMVNMKTESRLAADNAWQEYKKPTGASY